MIPTSPVTRPTGGPAAVAARGEALLAGLGISPRRDSAHLAGRIQPETPDPFSACLRDGLTILLGAVHSRQEESAALAGHRLIGLGPGLTPLGDDYLAGSALTVSALGDVAGFDGPGRERWLQALLPSDVRVRTTAVSADLLEMARGGRAAEPLHGLLDLSPGGEANLGRALAALVDIGASTGRGYAASIGASALLLAAAPPPVDDRKPKLTPGGGTGPR
jgi:hypothetical protein